MTVQLYDNHIKNSPLSPYRFRLYRFVSSLDYPDGCLVAAAVDIDKTQSINLVDSRRKALTTAGVFTLVGPAPETETHYYQGTPFAAALVPLTDHQVTALGF